MEERKEEGNLQSTLENSNTSCKWQLFTKTGVWDAVCGPSQKQVLKTSTMTQGL